MCSVTYGAVSRKMSCTGYTWMGASSASLRSCAVIIPSSNIRRSTYILRAFERSGCANGEYLLGACGSPAISEISGSDSSQTFLRK